MNDIKAKVLALLKSWPIQKRKIEQLRFELEHPVLIGEQELIGSLSLGGCPPGERGLPNGGISNKTMTIALQYQDIRQRMMGETISDIVSELRFLEAEMERLEYYISLLSEDRATVIRMLYFEQVPWDVIETKLCISKRTMSNYRNDALNELTTMYSYLESVKSKTPENPD